MGKNSVENSLKRFLKRRVKITLGFVVAFMIMGTGVFAQGEAISQTEGEKVYENIYITEVEKQPDGTRQNGISLVGETKGTFNGETLNINIKDKNITDSEIAGVVIRNGAIGVFNAKNTIIDVSNTGKGGLWGFGLLVNSNNNMGGKAEFNGENVTINNYQKNYTSQTLTAKTNSTIDFNNTGDVNISSKSEFAVTAVDNQGGKITFNNTGNVNILGEILPGNETGKANVIGIQSGTSNSITEVTDRVNEFNITLKGAGVDSDGTSYSTGTKAVTIKNGSEIDINSKYFNIKMDIDKDLINTPPEGHTSKEAYGLDSIGGIIEISENTKTNIEINQGQGDVYVVKSKGNESSVNILGDIYIKANGTGENYALYAEENGFINVGKDDKIVQITGDINAESSATIKTNLSTEDSFINGTITDNNKTGNITLGISNGATWTNTGESSVTNLTLNNGVINNSSVDNNITIDNLSGAGGTLNLGADIDGSGKATSGTVSIGNIQNGNARFAVNYSGDSDFSISSEEEAKDIFKALAGNIKVTGSNKFDAAATLEEGLVSDSFTSDITVAEGEEVKVSNTTREKNPMVEGITDLGTINLLTWRQEMNSLNKRMGELRNSTGEHGVWSRVYTGKIENGDRYDNDYQTYQVGYDKKYSVDNGTVFVGGLVSYSKGETNYELGTGENYSVGAGIYATWLNNDGQFADVVLKQSRLHNKFDVSNESGKYRQTGDYNNWGTSLSGQYGKRFDVNDKLFIEPSAELTLGRVEDTTYTTSAGVNVHQDTMYSLVGNLGTAVGYKLNDKGNIYTRVSLVREFQGDIDTYYEYNSATNETHEDLADTWVEFGIGTNYRFAEDLNVYVDLQKTGEATVDTEWQANLGFRYEF